MISCRKPAISAKNFVQKFSSKAFSFAGLSYHHEPDNDALVYRTVGKQLELTAEKHPNDLAISSYHGKKGTVTYPEVLYRVSNFFQFLFK